MSIDQFPSLNAFEIIFRKKTLEASKYFFISFNSSLVNGILYVAINFLSLKRLFSDRWNIFSGRNLTYVK